MNNRILIEIDQFLERLKIYYWLLEKITFDQSSHEHAHIRGDCFCQLAIRQCNV